MRTFALTEGPAERAMRRLHLTRRDDHPRALAIVAIAWVPLLLGALSRVLVGERPEPILFDLSVHVRLLVAIPLMIVGARLLAQRTRGATGQLYDGNFADPDDLDRILDRATRLRDSRLALWVTLGVVLVGGLGTVTGLFGATGVFSGIEDGGRMSFARFWYALVALPMVQFLFLRWLWHWGIWSYVVLRVSRLKLAMIATHPDHAGGIDFLSGPVSAFAFLVAAQAATFAGVWGTEILHHRATLQSVVPSLIGYLMLSVVIATAPLFAFVPKLYYARHREVRKYNGLALRYVRDFQHKWVEAQPESPLGTSDIQSLNDLLGSYAQLRKIRPVPFGTRPLLVLWGAAVLPMTPLAFAEMPITEVFNKLGHVVLGVVAG